ncbi:Dabb family protein [Fibrella sp. HMF5405]|uniref:Dabb family protein n=1 Tax=Fibrella forsythiae TaxID=2817061 RepID=A0ABS3JFN1_9BACT|nr:Dabb family protein [Fibrella forsythiae]
MIKSFAFLFAATLLSASSFASSTSETPRPPKKQTATSVAAKSMVQHIVLFKFKPEATPEKVAEIVAAFEALPSKIKEIKGFQWGTNNSPEKLDKGLTHAFILTFDNEKDRDTYLPHPAHKAFGGIVGPWLADVTVVDFTNKGK